MLTLIKHFDYKKLVLFIVLLFPTWIFSQPREWSNSKFGKVIEKDGGNKVFTKVETLPSLKISKEAYEDSLAAYLKLNKAFFKTRISGLS